MATLRVRYDRKTMQKIDEELIINDNEPRLRLIADNMLPGLIEYLDKNKELLLQNILEGGMT